MMKFISRIAVTLVALSSLAVAQCDQDTVPSQLGSTSCEFTGCLGGADSVVVMRPFIGGFTFGISSAFVEPFGSTDLLLYTDTYGVRHVGIANVAWDAWIGGGPVPGYFSY